MKIQTYGFEPKLCVEYLLCETLDCDKCDVAVCKADTGLPAGTDARTLSLWAKSDSAISTDTGLFSYGIDSAQNLFGWGIGNGYVEISGHEARYGSGQISTAVTMTNWNHIMVTMTANAWIIYINNSSIGSGTGNWNTTLTSLYIGSYWDNARYISNWTGRIASVRILNRVVTAEERNTLYAEHMT